MSHTIIKRAIVYARVSSDQQRDSGSSLDTQAAACLALAKREGYSVLAVVQESFSGAELWARPKLGQIREQIRSREIDALICYTVDRLTRNIAHLMVLLDECERFGVVPLFVMESLDQSPEGKLLMSVRGYVGEVERLKIIERTSRGRRARIDRGQLPGSSTSLYGYDRNAETSARTINGQSCKRSACALWRMGGRGSGRLRHKIDPRSIAIFKNFFSAVRTVCAVKIHGSPSVRVAFKS